MAATHERVRCDADTCCRGRNGSHDGASAQQRAARRRDKGNEKRQERGERRVRIDAVAVAGRVVRLRARLWGLYLYA